MRDDLIQIAYIAAAVLFILGLKSMSSPRTARKGIMWAGVGMLVATAITFATPEMGNFVWMTLALVAYFQDPSWLGLSPLSFTILCVAVAIVVDQIFDNLVTPRIISQALRVHPAAVLIAALVLANLLGILGIVVAAPVLATVALFWRYVVRKMFDLDPWPAGEFTPSPRRPSQFLARVRRFFRGPRKRAT